MIRLIFALCFLVSFRAQAGVPVYSITIDASGTTITSAAYVQLDASLDATCNKVLVFNSTGKVLYLGVGGSGSEQKINFDIPPSSVVEKIAVGLKKGQRLSVRAIGADATTGFFVFNCLQ